MRPSAAGDVGQIEHIGKTWEGWRGRLAHPDSPQGGGGPGFFAQTGGSEHDREVNPWRANRLADSNHLPHLPAGTPPRKNPPPVTRARKLELSKEIHGPHIEVKIGAAILKDGTSRRAETTFHIPQFHYPGYEAKGGKISKFRGKFTWTGTITIQSQFSRTARQNAVSAYGRGTTPEDVAAGDITLGFHESCHQADYEAFLKAHPLPDPPTLTVGMPAADYDKDVKRFTAEFKAYTKNMSDDSIAKTDEVGHKKSELPIKGRYIHKRRRR